MEPLMFTSVGKYSRSQIDDICLIFPRGFDMSKSVFWEKNKKKYFQMSSAEFLTQSAKL